MATTSQRCTKRSISEYLLNCVFDPATNALPPVGDDGVHLANSVAVPTRQFAAVANDNRNLPLVQPMAQCTQAARSILSWGLRPTSCTYQPIWGNWLGYRQPGRPVSPPARSPCGVRRWPLAGSMRSGGPVGHGNHRLKAP